MLAKSIYSLEQFVERCEPGAFRNAGAALLRVLNGCRYVFRLASRADRKRLKLGSIYQTPVFAAPSSLILAAIFYFYFGPFGILIGAVGLMMHEFAHVLEARRHNIPTSNVLISAMGAAANIEMNDENHFLIQPEAEWRVAAAGPLMSLLLAALGYAAATFFLILGWDASIPALIGKVNLALGLFNLIPMLPLDGGRILQGVLHQHVYTTPAKRLSHAEACLKMPTTFYWGFIFFAPWLAFILFYIQKARRRDIQGTIGFLEWQIENEMRRARNDAKTLLLYTHHAWWKVLGLDEFPGSISVLKKAYRKAAHANHPDRGGSGEATRRIRNAYEAGVLQLG